MTTGKIIAMILGLGLIALIIVVIMNVVKKPTQTTPANNMLSSLLGTNVNVGQNGTSVTNGYGGGYSYNPATGYSGNPDTTSNNQFGEPTVNGYTAAQYLAMGYSQADIDLLFS